MLERASAAVRSGFPAVEFWWPFDSAVPSDRQADEFVRSISDSGATLIALNFFGGNIALGDRGLLSLPSRESEFLDNLAAVADLGARLGCHQFNLLYGNRHADLRSESQDELATERLVLAASTLEKIAGTILIEALSGFPQYPLTSAEDVIAVIARGNAAGASNISMLADLYHLAVNGQDLAGVIRTYLSQIGHVQIADAPGRHEPGTGNLPLLGWLQLLEISGYNRWIALEYQPSGETTESFRWISEEVDKSGTELV